MSVPGVADPALSALAAQVEYAYGRAVDDSDLATLEALAHPDVRLTRADNPTRHGRDEFLALYRGFAALQMPASLHIIQNVQAFPDGDEVLVKAYFTAIMLYAEGSRLVVGRYEDSMRDDGDGLRFSHKRIRAIGEVPMETALPFVGVTPAP